MTDALWTRLSALVPDALERPEPERGPFLRRACGADAELLAEARALVAAAEAADRDGSLASPVGSLDDVVRSVPDRLGPWRVTGRLGEGGMGEVYRAERADGLYERTVALKRLRPGLGEAYVRRLDAERRVLARLEHPGIARLYDAGTVQGGLSDGAPYVVMELVDGAPLTDHAAAAGLDVRARVALFVEVCEAVAFAHSRLVVHRDIKPSNVFVTPDGAVKLLDFGIAKLLDEPAPAQAGHRDALATQTQRALTPAYAAPEQLRGDAVTTATDVYALGVTLFELLSGARPYSLSGTTAAEAERLVCETPPPAASTLAPPARRRHLEGDLDVIVAKALEKDPARRYASAEALGADLRRVLDGQPVLARPASRAYRARLFARRHRAGVAWATGLAAAVLVGLGSTAWQARAAAAERDRARDEAATATAVTAYLTSVFAQASPAVGPAVRPSELRLSDALRLGLRSADTAFTDRPAVRAAVLHTLGRTSLDLGLYDDAAPPLHEALRIREALPAAPADRIETLDALALLGMWRPDLADADALFERSLVLRRAAYGAASLEHAVGLANLAEHRSEQGDGGGALALLDRASAIVTGGPSIAAGEVLFVHAIAALHAGAIPQADSAFAGLRETGQALIATGELAPDDERIATVLVGLSQTRRLLGHADEARRLAAEALERRAARYDPGHPLLSEAQLFHAVGLAETGRPARAERLLRAALPALAGGDPYDESHPLARIELAHAVAAQGRPVDPDTLRDALAAVHEAVGASHPWSRYAARRLRALAAR